MLNPFFLFMMSLNKPVFLIIVGVPVFNDSAILKPKLSSSEFEIVTSAQLYHSLSIDR